MVMKETGMTWQHIMWQRSWLNIQMMIADAPGLKKQSSTTKKVAGKDLASFIRAKQNGG